ncbi:MAG: TrmH family RNA methyltransferase, partial [Parvularculaceae bacterium]
MTEARTSRRDGTGALSPAPTFVLVEPQLGENIGASARAMLNFGLSELRLVNPRDDWPNPAAAAMASGANSVVDAANVYATLPEALADCRYVLATTARARGPRLRGCRAS